jgi:hypothetical protein
MLFPVATTSCGPDTTRSTALGQGLKMPEHIGAIEANVQSEQLRIVALGAAPERTATTTADAQCDAAGESGECGRRRAQLSRPSAHGAYGRSFFCYAQVDVDVDPDRDRDL